MLANTQDAVREYALANAVKTSLSMYQSLHYMQYNKVTLG